MLDALLHGEIETETRWPSSLSDFAGLEPGMLLLAGSTLAFSLSIDVISWFIPEYLNRVGANFTIIGIYASIALLVRTAYPYLFPKLRNLSSKKTVLTVAGLASKGAILWVLAEQLGFIVPIPPWVTVTVGTMLVMTWQTHGPGALYDRVRIEAQTDADRDRSAVSGVEAMKKVGSFLLLLPATFVLVFVGSFSVSVEVMATFIAAVGLFATGSLLVLHDDVSFPDLSYTRPPLSSIRTSLSALTDDLRSALYGDALVHFSEAMIHVFLIIVIAQYHGVGLSVGPLSLPPEAFFGVLVAVELLVGLGSVLFGHHFVAKVGPKPAVLVGGLAAAVFPVALVLSPSHPAAIGLLFAFFGLRFAGVPARRSLFHDEVEANVAPQVDQDTTTILQATHLARDAAAVPGGIVGGILFGIAPEIAFGVAGATALVGLRQFLVFID